MSAPSLLRTAEHKALETLTLTGTVLDLGGETHAAYLSHIRGDFTTTAMNLDQGAKPDIFHDLEQPLPVADASFDHALLINVLEHIFNYHQLLTEVVRVVRPSGTIVVIVPFLFPIHPSPSDYWRFSDAALRKEFELLGLSNITITPLGSGVFATRYLLLDRLLPWPLRMCNAYVGLPVVLLCDRMWTALAHTLGKRYTPHEYPLGYLATATRR